MHDTASNHCPMESPRGSNHWPMETLKKTLNVHKSRDNSRL